METTSILFRLQRTTTEEAFVSVPITPDLLVEDGEGAARLDLPALLQRAVELGHGAGVRWRLEAQSLQPHPVQKPPDTDE